MAASAPHEVDSIEDRRTKAREAFGGILAKLAGPIGCWLHLSDADEAHYRDASLSPFTPRAVRDLSPAAEVRWSGTADLLATQDADPAGERARVVLVDAASKPPHPARLSAALSALARDTVAILLLPRTALTSPECAPIRSHLAESHAVEAILSLSWRDQPLPKRGVAPPRPGTVPAPQFFGCGVIVLRVGGSRDGGTRFFELDGLSVDEWVPMVREGAGHLQWRERSIRFSRHELDAAPWTQRRFSLEFRTVERERRLLGDTRPLSEFAELHVGSLEPGSLPRGGNRVPVAMVGATGLVPSGRPEMVWLQDSEIPEADSVEAGDVLVSFARTEQGRLRLGVVEPEHVPLAIDRRTIRIRWRDSAHAIIRIFLTDYLRSPFVAAWLGARGFSPSGIDARPLSRELQELPVPEPAIEVQHGIGQLELGRLTYLTWALEAERRRQALVDTTGDREQAVRRLLEFGRLEKARTCGAEEAGSLAGRIRQWFPRPIALRREYVRQLEPGAAQANAAASCAEHLLHLLAIMSIIQIAPRHDVVEGGLCAGALRARERSTAGLRLDWGTAGEIVHSAVKWTSKRAAEDRLSLPFPELVNLQTLFDESESAAAGAISSLRDVRNHLAHLHELHGPRAEECAAECVENLDLLLEACSFLTATPLIHVRRYENARGRRFRYEALSGVTSVARLDWKTTDFEVIEGSVGFLDHRGVPRWASPWLIATPPRDRRLAASVARLDRFDCASGEASYVDMETGESTKCGPENTGVVARWFVREE